MICHVRWSQTASDKLSKIWLAADSESRPAITAASHEIERQLRNSPRAESESRDAGRRVMFAAPLEVLFRVDDDDMLVSVLKVWHLRLHSD